MNERSVRVFTTALSLHEGILARPDDPVPLCEIAHLVDEVDRHDGVLDALAYVFNLASFANVADRDAAKGVIKSFPESGCFRNRTEEAQKALREIRKLRGAR